MAQNDKKALRRRILRERRAVSMEKRACFDAAILRQLLRLVREIPAEKPVFCYVGADFEIATRTFLTACLNEGRKACVPLCLDFGEMEARLLSSMDDLQPGAYGLPEPMDTCPVIEPAALGAVIVPGLAFDEAGYRLGRGGGFYDRYLAALPEKIPAWGLCYRQFLRSVPRDSHDVCVQSIITEEGVIACR